MNLDEIKNFFIKKLGKEPLDIFCLNFKLYDDVTINKEAGMGFISEQAKQIKTLMDLEIFNEGTAIGHLLPPFESCSDEWQECYIRNSQRLFRILLEDKINLSIACKLYSKDILNVYVAVLKDEFEVELTNEHFPKTINKNDKNYKLSNKASFYYRWNFRKDVKPYQRVELFDTDKTEYLSDIIIRDLDKNPLGELSDWEMDKPEVLRDAIETKSYIAYVSKLKRYGCDVMIKVVVGLYVNDNVLDEYYPKDKEEYEEYKKLIPEKLFGRKKNKTNIWKIKLFEKVNPGTILQFCSHNCAVYAVDSKTKKEIGIVDNSNVPGSSFVNKFNDEIRRNIYDIVCGVVLDEQGTFAYSTYNKRGVDFNSSEFKLNYLEFISGKDSEEYKRLIKKLDNEKRIE